MRAVHDKSLAGKILEGAVLPACLIDLPLILQNPRKCGARPRERLGQVKQAPRLTIAMNKDAIWIDHKQSLIHGLQDRSQFLLRACQSKKLPLCDTHKEYEVSKH